MPSRPILSLFSLTQTSNAQDPKVISITATPVEIRGESFRVRLNVVVRNEGAVRWESNGATLKLAYKGSSHRTEGTASVRSLNPLQAQQISITPNARFQRDLMLTSDLPIHLRNQVWIASILLPEFNQDSNYRNNTLSVSVKSTVNAAASRSTNSRSVTSSFQGLRGQNPKLGVTKMGKQKHSNLKDLIIR